MAEATAAALDLLNRINPKEVEKCLAGLSELIEDEDVVGEIYQKADKPLTLDVCQTTGNEFLQCEFNREDESYRSPWSNAYQPPIGDGPVPPENLRELEQATNTQLLEYKKLYFGLSAVSSAYFWHISDNQFGCAVLIRKDLKDIENLQTGIWETTHLIQATLNNDSVDYQVTSTILLQVLTHGTFDLSGHSNRQTSKSMSMQAAHPYGDYHSYNILCLMEDIEKVFLTQVASTYLERPKVILDKIKSAEGSDMRRKVF